jgi:hypothetical protein
VALSTTSLGNKCDYSGTTTFQVIGWRMRTSFKSSLMWFETTIAYSNTSTHQKMKVELLRSVSCLTWWSPS